MPHKITYVALYVVVAPGILPFGPATKEIRESIGLALQTHQTTVRFLWVLWVRAT